MILEDKDFIGREFPQNCGDFLKVLGSELIQEKDRKRTYYIIEFKKYPFKTLASKQKILKGSVNNPLIEKYEFEEKIWPQNCGDDLRILKKIGTINHSLIYECEFIKYPYSLKASKQKIKLGSINNPRIEIEEFVDKIWPQNCGDSLKILEKSDVKKGDTYLWKCEFIKCPFKILARKGDIIEGAIQNPNFVDVEKFPYMQKETLIKYIKDKYKNNKPTLKDLADDFNLTLSPIGKYIKKFNLESYISYYEIHSYEEEELYTFIKDIKNEFENNVWNLLKNYEIDIYSSKLKLGFEFNGNYWHSNIFKKSNYHQEKSLLAQEKGINLVHIFEYEWLEKKDLIKSLIKSKLGIFDKKIFARKCQIKELDYKEYANFCNQNHLQGECGAKVKLGLFYKNELIQIMSFGVPRFTDKFDWEIIRECSKINYIIVGGKEKLWSYFIKNHSPKNCISYCDFSKFTGDSYLKLGFKKERLNKPGFVWWDKKLNITYWRNPIHNQEMKDKDYLKIYDCGQLVFVWNKI